jgi:hypothetical protein
VIGWGSVSGFLWLFLNWKLAGGKGRDTKKLSIINQFLAIPGHFGDDCKEGYHLFWGVVLR